MFEEDVSSIQQNLVLQGVAEILNLAKVGNSVQVKNFGIWRNTNWLTGNILNAYQSVDWYCGYSRNKERNQLHCGKLYEAITTEPWQETQPHHDILILKSDLYDNDVNWCFGYAVLGQMAVSSVYRFEKWLHNDYSMQRECFKTIIMHEVGHMLGLVNENRTDIEYNLGWHCTNNNCIMRQGLTINAWVQYTHERLNMGKSLCPHCQSDLRNHIL